MRETVLELLTRLEILLQRAAAVPLTEQKGADDREALGVVRMIRAQLPDELRQAQRLREDAERLLRMAQDDARAVREGADVYAARVLSDLEQSVTRLLETIRRGRELLKDAHDSAYNEQSGSSR